MKKTAATFVLASLGAAFLAPSSAWARYPRIHNALRMLERSEAALSAAPPSFGGHKAQAQRLIHQAIEQLRLAIQFANQNQGRGGANGANINVNGGPRGVKVDINARGQIP